MSKLTKKEAERAARALWKSQKVPKQVRKSLQSVREVEKHATDWLRSTGFDLAKAMRLQAKRRAEWDRLAPKAAADAARSWAVATKRTQASAKAWGGRMVAAGGGAPPSGSFFVDTPVAIVASDPKSLKDSRIVRGNSFAKVLGDRKSSSVDTYSFIFGFHNGATTPFLFTFDTLLNVSGHLQMHVGAGIGNGGVVTVDAKLDVFAGNQVTDTQNVATIAAIGDGPPFFGGESNERTVSLTRFLTAPGIVVDPDSLAVLLVSMVVTYDLDDTHVVADFNAGNFRVLCPVVLVSRSALPLKASGLNVLGATV